MSGTVSAPADAPAAAPVRLPAGELFADVVGQEPAVAALRAAAARPVQAYLLRGAAGNGGLIAARAFAAALLCPDGGCGACRTCRAALAGSDPDLHFVHRTGAMLSVPDMRRLVALAQRRPLQAGRQVVIVTDVHLGGPAAPALLKTLEEPPGSTVFVLLADDIPPELATVASRCVQIPFPPVPRATMVDWLVGRGVPDDVAAVVADSSGGNPERARVMIEDPDVAARAALWSSVPDQLNDTGVVAAELARGLLASAERATEPLRAAHARELERLTEEAAEFGEKGLPGRKEITDRHQREERRWRTDALRAGLGALARAYRDRMTAQAVRGDAGAAVHAQAAADAVRMITEVAQALPRNPQESLLLQSLLVRLGALSV
jgi:DNA polymerase III subunit delta'